MRVTILPYAIILTKAHRAADSILAMGCIMYHGLRCFFFLLPNYTFCFLFVLFSDEPEVFLLKYSQTAIIIFHAAHFLLVVKQGFKVHLACCNIFQDFSRKYEWFYLL